MPMPLDVYHMTLNFNKEPLMIGGLSSADPILERPGQLHSDDLVGCVHSVSINGRFLNLSNPIEQNAILPTCNRNNNGGPCSEGLPEDPTLSLCGNYGTCYDRWHTAQCRCGGDLFSPDCYNSIEPISLSDGGFMNSLYPRNIDGCNYWIIYIRAKMLGVMMIYLGNDVIQLHTIILVCWHKQKILQNH
uniref:Uncharacterized protein n=1 Tax=Megaselia scalaris TaxID=36166 RepID=T1GIG1_MEGSC